MADNEFLSQASVDYLSQINRNVVALNATATAHKNISERVQPFEATKFMMGDIQANTASRISNQAYMAYGTAQHDMKELVGVTDQTTRMAMTTLRIAGGNAISDVNSVAGRVVNTTAGGISSGINLISPTPVRNQGILGALAGWAGLSAAPNTMLSSDYRKLSELQTKDIGHEWINMLTALPTLKFSKMGEVERGKSFDPLEMMINRPRMADNQYIERRGFDSDERKYIGEQSYWIGEGVRRRGMGGGDVDSIMDAGLRISANLGVRSKEDVVGITRELAGTVTELNRLFKATGSTMANLIADIQSRTGMSVKGVSALVTGASATAVNLGLNPDVAVSEIVNPSIDFSQRTGLSFKASANQFLQTYQGVREKSMSDPEYGEFVARQGGVMNVVQNDVSRQLAFNRSNTGLLFKAAEMAGGSTDPMNLLSVHAAARKTLMGGGKMLARAKYEQLAGGTDGAISGLQSKYFNIYQQLTRDYTSKLEDLKYGDGKKDFIGAIAIAEGMNNLDEATALYGTIMGVITPETKALTAGTETWIATKQKQQRETVGWMDKFGTGLRNIGKTGWGAFVGSAATDPGINPSGNAINNAMPTNQPSATSEPPPARLDPIEQSFDKQTRLNGDVDRQIDTLKVMIDQSGRLVEMVDKTLSNARGRE